MERFFSDLKTVQRFRSGPLGVYVQKLADQLADSGFRRRTIRVQLRAADHFGRWICLQSLILGGPPSRILAREGSGMIHSHHKLAGSINCGLQVV